jgi:hypothetical protein
VSLHGRVEVIKVVPQFHSQSSRYEPLASDQSRRLTLNSSSSYTLLENTKAHNRTMYSLATGRAMGSRTLHSSSNCLIRSRWSAVRSMITWRSYSRKKYIEDPEYPTDLYHPSFSMGFNIDSSAATALNELRAKYGMASPTKSVALPWRLCRAFQSYPLEHREFCQTVLATVASQHSCFPIDIGQPFRTLDDAERSFVGFQVSSPILQDVYAKLLKEFDHIRRDMLLSGSRRLKWKDPHPRFKMHYSVRTKFTPKIYICKPPKEEAEAILNDLQKQRGVGTWTAKVTGLNLGRDARATYYRSPDYVERLTKFDFQDHENS